MIDINEKIKNISEYFLGMNVADGFIYITVQFPEGWKISNRLEEKFDVKAILTENGSGYYFFTSMMVGFEKLFDAIEDTISFNKVAAIKQQMFLEKIKELQIIFEDEPIEVLETIEFKYKKKRTKKKNENEEKEVESCQTE
jgi:hypothetical protein